MKRKKTRFESFAQRFLILSMAIFVFGNLAIKAMEASYVNKVQRVEEEIHTLTNKIDGLKLEKDKLVSFSRLNEVAKAQGYDYRSSDTMSMQGTADDAENSGVITE